MITVHFKANPIASAPHHSGTLSLNASTNHEAYAFDSTMGCFYKCVKNTFLAHREDGPAVMCSDIVWFFYEGINYSIQDMPNVDEETKLIWTLKYQPISCYDDYYATYEPLPNFNVDNPYST